MKKVTAVAGGFVLSAVILTLALISCANPVSNLTSNAASKSLPVTQTSSYTLWAGQTINAGTVSFTKDASNLYITYATNANYLIATTHVWVGTDPTAVPHNKSDILQPGQFKDPGTGNFGSEVNYSPSVSTATITVPLSTWPTGTTLVIFTHAALVGATPSVTGQTGFGGDVGVNIEDNGRWYYYIVGLDPRGVPDATPTTTTTIPTTTTSTTTTTTTLPNVVYYDLSGAVFHDLNANGVKDSGEEGIAGVTLTLSTGATAVSGSDGSYTFANLVSGAYTVTSGGATGYFATPYAAPVSSKSVSIVSASVSGVNFGLSYQSISGYVFKDTNADGSMAAGENGISGVSLTLSGAASATGTSGSDGSFLFDHLKGGTTYTVTSGGATGYFATPYDEPVSSRSVTIASTSVSGVNFGLSYESISGYAFKDTNADGSMAASENGISGVSLTLSGAANKSMTSGSDGFFLFDHLKGGSASYTVAAGVVTGEFHTPYLNPVTSWTGTASARNVNFGYSHESITGVVFYDLNHNDKFDAGEPTLDGFVVRLGNKSATSANGGAYIFDNLMGATAYTVTADDRTGFVHSTASSRTVTPANSVPAVANFGFAVDYDWMLGKTANGFTIGYWKTNLDKAIAGKTNGVQVSAAKLGLYVNALSNFQLPPLNVTSMSAASAILSKTSSAASDLLAKQLMGSEFNYQNGAYIGGNVLATYFFLYDGEYMLNNLGSFSSAQLLAQKAKYEAYNSTEGGTVAISF